MNISQRLRIKYQYKSGIFKVVEGRDVLHGTGDHDYGHVEKIRVWNKYTANTASIHMGVT